MTQLFSWLIISHSYCTSSHSDLHVFKFSLQLHFIRYRCTSMFCTQCAATIGAKCERVSVEICDLKKRICAPVNMICAPVNVICAPVNMICAPEITILLICIFVLYLCEEKNLAHTRNYFTSTQLIECGTSNLLIHIQIQCYRCSNILHLKYLHSKFTLAAAYGSLIFTGVLDYDWRGQGRLFYIHEESGL